jgi:quinol monooxygenase YgiN
MAQNAAVVVMFHARSKPGKESRLNDLLTAAAAHIQTEAGCLKYEFHQHETEPREFIVLERWATRPDYDIHLIRPYTVQLNTSLEDFVEHAKTDVTSITH